MIRLLIGLLLVLSLGCKPEPDDTPTDTPDNYVKAVAAAELAKCEGVGARQSGDLDRKLAKKTKPRNGLKTRYYTH